MRRVALNKIPLRTASFMGWGDKIRGCFLALFLLQLLLVGLRVWWPAALFGNARWPDGVLIVLATATTLASLARQLPGQNVMLAAVLISSIAGAVQTLGARTAIPFGPYVYTANIGQRLFEPLPWAVPLVWLVIILNARGVARLILRPWRKTQAYGFWLMGWTALLVVVFDFALEPFATQVKHYWFWNPTKLPLDWYSTPWVNFLGWAATTLLILAFVTPSLINKKPVKHPPDYHPLLIWVLLNALLVIGEAKHHLWPAALLVSALTIVLSSFAVRGARW